MELVDFNGRFLERTPTGVDRFALETLLAVDALLSKASAPRYRVRLLYPEGARYVPSLSFIEAVEVRGKKGSAWEQTTLPLVSKKSLLVNLCNTAPLLRDRQICVIHDAATVKAPDSYNWKFRAWYGIAIPWIYRRSARVLTVSESARQDLAEVYGARGGVGVLPEGAEHIERLEADQGVLTKHGLGRRPYVLAVSSLAPHKNFGLVAQALNHVSHADFDLVVAGGKNTKVFAQSSLPEHVRQVGYVSDAELKALFQNAACFVFPSLYEGFGLPPLEAMACGCPVIASRAASIPEVCADAADYFDPRDAIGLATALDRVLSEPSHAEALRGRGLVRAQHWRWSRTGAELLRHIDEVIGEPA